MTFQLFDAPKLMALKISGLVVLGPLVAFGAPGAAAQEASGAGPAALQLAAKGVLAIEQMHARYMALATVAVQQSPNEDSRQIASLRNGESVLVTGRVNGVDWYRVYIDDTGIGYVQGGFIVVERKPEPGTQLALVAPPEPVTDSPVQPAVGVFEPPEGVFRDCPRCPQMVTLSPGGFTMGSATGDPTEQPVHDVTIAYGFALGRFEVTIAQWMACVDDGGCTYKPREAAEPDRTPVRNLSWDDATEYVSWLAKVTSRPYRLPSEAEWEYAVRAGTEGEYWWGDAVGSGKADCKDCGGAWDRKKPALVGSFQASPLGLFDMNGGIAEWTGDCWFKSYAGAPGDGSARDKQDCQQRVLRGGSWRNDASYLRSSSRFYYDANVNYSAHGLRVALTLE